MELESCFRLLVPFDLDPTPGAAWPAMAEEGGRDEEQPCCSKTLAACTRRPGAAGAEGPPAEDRDEDSDPEGFVRHHGLGSREYTLEVELSSGAGTSQSLGFPSCGGRGDRLVGPHCDTQAQR